MNAFFDRYPLFVFSCSAVASTVLAAACGSDPAPGASQAATGSSGASTSGASSGHSGDASGLTASGASTGVSASGASGTTGSSAGSGVSSDAGSGTDTGLDSTTGQSCASLPLCDDFEADMAGSPPSTSLWGVIGGAGCGGQAAYSVTVDTTQFHSGSKSVKVVGGDSCGPLMVNSSAFAKLSGGEVYGRFYMRFSTATPFAHTVFAALGFQADGGPFGNNQSNYLQMAALADGTTPVIQWNYVDTELPQRNGMELPQNVYPAANAWTCIEFHTSLSQGSVEAWMNGAVMSGMTFIPGTTPVTAGNSPWSTKKPTLDVRSVSFGWVDVHQGTNTLWFDDIAVAGSRIGCQ